MPDEEHRIRVSLELNALSSTGALGDALEGAVLGPGTPIYDLNGTQLYERIPLTSDRYAPGYADLAVHPAIGAVLMGVSHGATWNEKKLLEAADHAFEEHQAQGAKAPDERRFVAYSYPKLGVQFLAGGKELALLELWSWLPVPQRKKDAADQEPSSFSRWSFLDDQPADRTTRRQGTFEGRVKEIEAVPDRAKLPLDRIDRNQFAACVDMLPRPPQPPDGGGAPGDGAPEMGDGGYGAGGAAGGGGGGGGAAAPPNQRELQFSSRGSNHRICYEVQGQATSLWCVAASVEMLLDFYRYEYDQDRLAAALGLGTHAKPSDLPVGQEGRIVTAIQALTTNALDVTMKTDPTWEDFRDEIVANRPVISLVPGHARTIAGYTDTGPVSAQLGPFRGLLVYDPWPPNQGVVTRWENVEVQIYTFAFLARIHLT
jgi:hypothetical protein